MALLIIVGIVVFLCVSYFVFKRVKRNFQRKKGWLWDINYEEVVTETPWQLTRTGMIGYRYFYSCYIFIFH